MAYLSRNVLSTTTRGNIGCLEQLASGIGIALRANEAIALGQGDELLAFAFAHESQEDRGADTPYDQRVAASAPHVNVRTVALAAEAGIESPIRGRDGNKEFLFWLGLYLANQGKRDAQEDAQADDGDHRVQERRGDQAATQAETL